MIFYYHKMSSTIFINEESKFVDELIVFLGYIGLQHILYSLISQIFKDKYISIQYLEVITKSLYTIVGFVTTWIIILEASQLWLVLFAAPFIYEIIMYLDHRDIIPNNVFKFIFMHHGLTFVVAVVFRILYGIYGGPYEGIRMIYLWQGSSVTASIYRVYRFYNKTTSWDTLKISIVLFMIQRIWRLVVYSYGISTVFTDAELGIALFVVLAGIAMDIFDIYFGIIAIYYTRKKLLFFENNKKMLELEKRNRKLPPVHSYVNGIPSVLVKMGDGEKAGS